MKNREQGIVRSVLDATVQKRQGYSAGNSAYETLNDRIKKDCSQSSNCSDYEYDVTKSSSDR